MPAWRSTGIGEPPATPTTSGPMLTIELKEWMTPVLRAVRICSGRSSNDPSGRTSCCLQCRNRHLPDSLRLGRSRRPAAHALGAGEAETNSSHATQSIPSGEKSVLVLVAATPSAKVRCRQQFLDGQCRTPSKGSAPKRRETARTVARLMEGRAEA